MAKLYLVKNKKNRIFGPYTEKEICFYIDEKEFKGEELFCNYPIGKWKALSTHPVFYKKIITALNQLEQKNDFDASYNLSKSEKSREELIEPTRILHVEKKSASKKKVKIKLSKEFKQEMLEEEGFEDVIEMNQSDQKLFKSLIKSIKPVVFVVGLLVVIFIFGFFIFPTKNIKKIEGIRLLSPKEIKTDETTAANKKQPADNKKQAKDIMVTYNKSTIALLVSTQKTLVDLLVSNPSNFKLHALLCLNHLELWPFAYQDTQDRETLKSSLSFTKKYDIRRNHASFCGATQSYINKKFEETIATSNRLLNTHKINIDPSFLFYLKAKALSSLNLQNQAISLIDSISVIQSEWIAPLLLKADIYYNNMQYGLAAKEYQNILKLYGNHTEARLRLGVLESKYFKKFEKSQKTLENTLANFNDYTNSYILFEAYSTLANIYLANNKKNLAIKYSNKAYKLNPQHPDILKLKFQLKEEKIFDSTKVEARALIYRGNLFMNQGDCNQAKKEFQKAYKVSKSSVAALKLAKCHWKSGASGQAIRWLKQSINQDSKMLEAYFLLSDYLSYLYDFESAQEVLIAAKKNNPSNSDLFKAYAQLSFRQKLYNQTITYSKRALKFYSFDADIYILLSRSYFALGDQYKAHYYARKAIKENINNIQVQISYALILDGSNPLENTEDYFKQLIENFPKFLEYPQALGEYYFDKSEFKKAQVQFESIIAKDPKFKLAYVYLGRTHKQLSLLKNQKFHYTEALKNFREASLLDLSDPQPVFYKARTHLDHEEYHKAQLDFEKILKLNSNYPMINFYIGLTLFYQGESKNLEKALNEAKTESEKNPENYLPYKLAGDIYKLKTTQAFEDPQEKQKIFELCIRKYQKALQYLKKDIEVSMGLLQCYKGSGNLDLALQLASQITKEEGLSGYPDIYREIGSIFEAKEDYKKAKINYIKYFQLKPAASDRSTIEARINKLIQKKESISKPQESPNRVKF